MTVKELIEILQSIKDQNKIVLTQACESGYYPLEDIVHVTVHTTGNGDCIHGDYEYNVNGIEAIVVC